MRHQVRKPAGILSILLILAMTAALMAGCSGQGGSTTAAPDNPQTTQAPAASTAAPTTAVPATEPPAPAPYGVYQDYLNQEPDTLNPHTYALANASTVFGMTSMTLYRYLPNDTGDGYVFVGALAEKDPVQVDTDMKVWQIPIIKTAKWENGDPITVDDVIYSFKMCLDPLLVNSRASGMASNYITIVNASEYSLQGSAGNVSWDSVGIKKIDDYTLQVELVNPVPMINVKKHFTINQSYIVHPATYEACMSADRTTCTYGLSKEQYMSCGQWILTDWILGAELDFKRNPDWVYADKVKMEGWTYRIIADANTALEMFLNGELDHVTLGASSKAQYAEDPRINITPAGGVWAMVVNMGNTNNNSILGNVKFRQALYYAVDRAALGKLLYGVGASWIVPLQAIADDDTGAAYRDLPGAQAILPENLGYQPEKAKKLYDEALAEAGLTSLTLTMSYNEGNANAKTSVEMLQDTLPGVFGDSFKLELSPAGSTTTELRRLVRTGENVNAFELTIMQWGPGTNPAAIINCYTSSYSNKAEPYFNTQVDELHLKATTEFEYLLDQSKRNELFIQAEKILIEDVCCVPLFENPGYQMFSDRVQLPVKEYIRGYGFGAGFATLKQN